MTRVAFLLANAQCARRWWIWRLERHVGRPVRLRARPWRVRLGAKKMAKPRRKAAKWGDQARHELAGGWIG